MFVHGVCLHERYFIVELSCKLVLSDNLLPLCILEYDNQVQVNDFIIKYTHFVKFVSYLGRFSPFLVRIGVYGLN